MRLRRHYYTLYVLMDHEAPNCFEGFITLQLPFVHRRKAKLPIFIFLFGKPMARTFLRTLDASHYFEADDSDVFANIHDCLELS